MSTNFPRYLMDQNAPKLSSSWTHWHPVAELVLLIVLAAIVIAAMWEFG